jgi:hypothetical protein
VRTEHEWHTLFCRQLGFGSHFEREFGEQLGTEAAREAGVDLRRGAFLAPADPDAISYGDDGASRADTDLVAPDGLGRPVTVAWRCASHPGERLGPGAPPARERGCRLLAWWDALPVEELRREQPRAVQLPAALTSALPFDIELWPSAFPDVSLDIRTGGPLAAGCLERAGDALDLAAARWNARPAGAPGIRYVGDPEQLGEDRFQVHIDMGGEGPDALAALLAALAPLAETCRLLSVIVR